MEDLVEDEWPAILMKTEPFDKISEKQLHIKDEQLSESESLYSSSPSLGPSSPPILNYYEIQDIKTANSLSGLVTLESLLDKEADTPQDNVILSRIKKLAAENLPEGWRNWMVKPLTMTDLLGRDIDPKIINKLRFALPTVGLARAFFPDCRALSEKLYTNLKVKMLEWPFCVGLIIGPSFLAARIRRSAIQHQLLLTELSDLKPLLLSREDASKELASEVVDQDDEYMPTCASSTLSRLDRLEQSQKEMKHMLQSLMRKFKPSAEKYPKEEASSAHDSFPVTASTQQPLISSTFEWPLPEWALSDTQMEDDVTPKQLGQEPYIVAQGTACQKYPKEEASSADNDNFPVTMSTEQPLTASTFEWPLPDWVFSDTHTEDVREQKAYICAPKPHIAAQGTACQRLGELSYKQIRYTESQKKLQAAPVFSALKVKPSSSKICIFCTSARSANAYGLHIWHHITRSPNAKRRSR